MGTRWRQDFINDHNGKMVVQMALLPLLPFWFIFIQAILRPGMVHCTDTDCPDDYEPFISDSITIPIASVIYAYCALLALTILLSSGSWMDNAFGKKVFSMLVLFFITFSLIQIIAPAVYRGHVLPYYSVQQYNITITANNNSSDNNSASTTATCTVSNLWSEYYYHKRHVLLRVRQLDSRETDILDISPLSKVVYHDGDYSNTVEISENSNSSFTKVVNNLKDGRWYIWELLPAREGVNGASYPGEYIHQPSSGDVTTVDGRHFTDAQVDLRAYKICKWNAASGYCDSSNGVH